MQAGKKSRSKFERGPTVPNRTIYLRVCIVEEIPTRKATETVEETIDGFEIEFTDLRDARRTLRSVSDALEDFEQEDMMDETGQDDDDGGAGDLEKLIEATTKEITSKVLRKIRR